MADKVYNQAMCVEAEQLLAAGKSIARVATNLGVCRDTIYDWRDKHPEFAKALKSGLSAAQARWEDIGESGIVGDLDKFSATAWMFTMKNRFREDYAEVKQDKTASETLVEKLLDRLID
jgi:hypothetical protein